MSAASAGSRNQFHSLLRRYGDIPYIATRSLGKHNKKLPAGKRSKYNRQVGLYVANGLAQNSKKFAGHSFKIVRCSGNRVETSVLRGTRSHKIVWRLRKNRGYKIVDINVQGIWVGDALRTDLQKVMTKSKGDYKALFAYLEKWSNRNWY